MCDSEVSEAATSSAGDAVEKNVKPPRKLKPGIVYLSSVPYFMTVRRVREYFTPYGDIGRLFLQHETSVNAAGKKVKRYTEGWIEFKDKRTAKRVAASLNNTSVGGRRRSKAYESLWNLRYLNRFRWIHLSEQLTYEKAVHQQRMRTEIAHVKREARFFAEQVEKGKHLARLEELVLKKGGLWERYQRQMEQRKTVQEKKRPTKRKRSDKDNVVDMVFGGNSGRVDA